MFAWCWNMWTTTESGTKPGWNCLPTWFCCFRIFIWWSFESRVLFIINVSLAYILRWCPDVSYRIESRNTGTRNNLTFESSSFTHKNAKQDRKHTTNTITQRKPKRANKNHDPQKRTKETDKHKHQQLTKTILKPYKNLQKPYWNIPNTSNNLCKTHKPN